MTTKIVDARKPDETAGNLPPSQKAIHVTYTDDESGNTFGGAFVIRRMNIGQMSQMAVTKAEMNGGMPDDSIEPAMRHLNTIRAHLRHAIVKAPEWWKPDEFYSGDILMEVYEEVMNFEESFRKPSQGHSARAEKTSEVEVTEPEPFAETLVDEEIQASPHASRVSGVHAGGNVG